MKVASSMTLIAGLALLTAGCLSSSSKSDVGRRATKSEINASADEALKSLYASIPLAKELGPKAKAIMVFPRILKAGLMVGGQFGDGVLLSGTNVVGYYNTASASFGLQAGAQGFSYALFFMSDKALEYVKKSEGWELGVGPSLVIVDTGVAKTLSTTTAKDDIYAMIFGQKGLMAGIGIAGSKVTPIDPAP